MPGCVPADDGLDRGIGGCLIGHGRAKAGELDVDIDAPKLTSLRSTIEMTTSSDQHAGEII